MFSALIRKGLRGDALEAVCESALLGARRAAAQAWAAVARAKVNRANTDHQKVPASRRHKVESMLSEASTKMRKGQKAKNPDDSICHLRHAIGLLEKYAEELGRV